MRYLVQITIKENGNIHNRYFTKYQEALDFVDWAESVPDFSEVLFIEL